MFAFSSIFFIGFFITIIKFLLEYSFLEFLSYIKNAECMITDSFHGTAFAINFNTQFVEVLPNNKTGTRNISILKMTGLSNRIANNYDLSVSREWIDFSEANKALEIERKKSIQILNEMLGE